MNGKKASLLPAALLVAPIVIMQGARLLLDSGPVVAAGATAIPTPEVQPMLDDRAALDERVVEAARFIVERRERLGSLESPIGEQFVEVVPAPVVSIDPGPPAPDMKAIASLKLTGVIATGSVVVASINSRLYKHDDVVASDWRITHIDARSQTVELTDSAGRVHVLVAEKPY
jgi:hypothetical protein